MDFVDDDEFLEDIPFYSSEKDQSTLCPVDWDNYFRQRSSSSSSLTYLCCVQVIRHAKFLVNEDTYFPSNIYHTLMKEALRADLQDSANLFILTWPFKVIKMTDVIPFYLPIFAQSISNYFDEFKVCKVLPTILYFIGLCFRVVRYNLTPYLRVFDLRGFILSDQILYYVICKIISFSTIKLLQNYHIILECKISNPRTLSTLMTLLEMNRTSHKNKIHLHFNKLDLSLLLENDTGKVLRQIDLTELTGLSMSYFSHDFLMSFFPKLSSLTALSLENTDMLWAENTLPFNLLPKLRRLSLEDAEDAITTCIPKCILGQLEHLTMSQFLDDENFKEDLLCITSVPKLHLRELNLSRNEVEPDHLYLWRKLLMSLVPTLKNLELESCIMWKNLFVPMIECILPLTNLEFLNFLYNRMTVEAMYEHVPKLGSMPYLKIVALSYPIDENHQDLGSDREYLTKLRCEVIKKRMAAKKLIPTKILWKSRN